MASKLPAIRFLLVRYLVSSWMAKKSRAQATIGVFLPILGVGIGVCAFTVVLSVMAGFVEGTKNRLLGLEPHFEIVRDNSFGLIDADAALIQSIQKLSRDIVSVVPFQKGDAILQSRNRATTVVLLGVEPKTGGPALNYDKYLTHGGELFLLEGRSPVLGMPEGGTFPTIVLGNDLLMHMGVEVGDRVTLVSTTPDEGPGGLAPKQFPVVIVDSLLTGSPTHNAKLVIGSLELVNNFFGTQDQWAGLQVRVKDPIDAERLLPQFKTLLEPKGLRAKPWTEANKALLRALKLERWGMSFVMYMVILVGCFSITITLVLAVKRKRREMAILRAIGFERQDLGRLYLFQGAAVGALGVMGGLLMGFGLLMLISRVPLPVLTSAYNGKPLPVLINWYDIAKVSLGSIALACLAAVWPAYEVMRIDVIETLADRN